MAKLTAAARKKIPSSKFGLPAERKYPVEDKVHARVAKSYASKEVKAGKLSPASKKKIDRKANLVLKGK
jgi:hypothetical protein